MDASDAAQHLYDALVAPRGTVNVAAVPDSGRGYTLVVWVSPGFVLQNVPDEFDGYPVHVKARPRFRAESRL